MSLNNISDLYPNTLSGLSSFNANQILINGVDISTIYVPFINSPSDVDLADKNFTTSGRVQTSVLKLPSATYSTTKVLRVNATKEVESVDLAPIYVAYTGSTANLDMGTFAVKSSYIPVANEDMINKRYADITLLTQADATATYLSQANAALDYVSYFGAIKNVDIGSYAFRTYYTPTQPNDLVNKAFVDSTFLTQANASSTYLTQTNAALTYLTQSDAGTTYLTIANASSTYLTQGAAASTYLTQANASSTYATITNLNLKAPLASPTFTGTVTLPSTVMFSSTPSVGTGTLLAIDGSGNLVTTTSSTLNQTATSTNATYYLTFVASSSTGTFTPLVYSQIMCNPNIGLIEVNNIKVTSRNQGGSQVSLLGRDSAGNVIDGFMSQTASSANTDFPVGFIQSSGTGLFTPLNETSGAFTFNPSTLKLKTSKLQITSVPTGTQTFLLAVDSAGNVIQGTGGGGVPTQIDPTPINTSTTLYPVFLTSTAGGASTTYVESDGSLFYNPSTNRLTVPIVSASSVVETSAIQNSSGQIININAQGGAIAGNRLNLQIQSTTYYYFDKDAFYLTQPVNNVISSILNDLYILWPSAKILSLNNWVQIDNTGLLMAGTRKVYTQNLETQPTTDLNINVPTSSNLCNFQINGSTVLSVNSTGLRPSTDTLSLVYSSMPTLKFTDGTNNMTIVSYVGGAEFRYAGTTRLGFDATGMYVNNIRNISGVNLDINGNGAGIVNLQSYGNNVFQTNATGARVTASSGSLVFTNTANIQTDSDGFNWYIGGASQVGYFDKNAWATGYGWRIHSNAFATYECAYDMIIQCKTGGVPQYGANNRIINVITPNSINSPNDIGGSGWYCGATVFRSENGGNVGNGIGISTSSSPGYGGNNWGYITAVNPGNYWTNWIFAGATGYWYCNGTACAYINSTSGWQAVSDERCKRDINDLSTKKSLQRVLKCKPKYYKRILKEPKGENPIPLRQQDIDRVDIGLLAQEVLEYNPHCVSTWEDDTEDGKKVERLGLAYQDFIIHLIGSVQEQQKQIEAQQAKIEEQSQAINTLTESMKMLTEHLATLTTAFNKIVKE